MAGSWGSLDPVEWAPLVAVALAAGGAAGFWLRELIERRQRGARQAHESEAVRAVAVARDRAREEKLAALQRLARLRDEHGGCAARLEELERRLAAQAAGGQGLPAEWFQPIDGAPDDLTRIHGLGPVLAQRLDSLGLRQYRQLALITPDNAAWVAARLQILPGRILGDRWAVQAQQLLARQGSGGVDSSDARDVVGPPPLAAASETAPDP